MKHLAIASAVLYWCVGVTRSFGSGWRLTVRAELGNVRDSTGRHLGFALSPGRHATRMALGRLTHYGIDLVMLSVILAGVKRTSGFGCAPYPLACPWPREGRGRWLLRLTQPPHPSHGVCTFCTLLPLPRCFASCPLSQPLAPGNGNSRRHPSRCRQPLSRRRRTRFRLCDRTQLRQRLL